MKIAILTTRHTPLDDRLFHHMARILARQGEEVVMVSSREAREENLEGVKIRSFEGRKMSHKEKNRIFLETLREESPGMVIVPEPFPLFVAARYRKKTGKVVKIVYDITEWYPGKKELERWGGMGILLFPLLVVHNLLAAAKTDAFIFGERCKALPFRLMCGRKPHIFLGYTPLLELIPFHPPSSPAGMLNLSYSGKLSREKGLEVFLDVVELLAEEMPSRQIRIRLIGFFRNRKEEGHFRQRLERLPGNITWELLPFLPLEDYLQKIRDDHFFFDLRRRDPENHCSLPIKLFYFIALGRPLIFSDLLSIRKEMGEKPYLHRVRPQAKEKIAGIIKEYLKDPERYQKVCNAAREEALQQYNWERAGKGLLPFLQKIVTS